MSNMFGVPYIFNPGILTGRIPEDLFSKIREIVHNPDAKKQPRFSKNLVGSIREEYQTPEIPGFYEYIDEMYRFWVDTYKTPNVPYKLDTPWTNYMKRGEFNPNHSHPNAIAAYVIWITIPYNIEDEMTYNDYDNELTPCKNSCFEFTYSLFDGRIANYPIRVDKTHEGVISMFPASLIHCVYPFFTSDKERISIAGNVYFKQ